MCCNIFHGYYLSWFCKRVYVAEGYFFGIWVSYCYVPKKVISLVYGCHIVTYRRRLFLWYMGVILLSTEEGYFFGIWVSYCYVPKKVFLWYMGVILLSTEEGNFFGIWVSYCYVPKKVISKVGIRRLSPSVYQLFL